MKYVYILLAAFLFSVSLNAQIIDIPDANFKNALLAANVDTNGDGEISVSEAEDRFGLDVNNQSIASLEGIEFFVNLEVLECGNNLLSTLDVSNMSNLGYLGCYGNQLTTLILGNSDNLFQIECQNNQLTAIDFSGYPYMNELYCFDNQITSLDFSNHLVQIFALEAFNNPINSLFFKNNIDEFGSQVAEQYYFGINPTTYICADEDEIYSLTNILSNQGYSDTDYIINSYCSFTPGGDFYTIEGTTVLDIDDNGCNGSDSVFPNLGFTIANGTETGSFISNSSGNYSIPVQDGSHTITPIFESSDYFSVSPPSLIVNFPADASPFLQDFCITPNGTYNDLEITIIPTDAARPGFDANYKLVYKNKGTTTLSGSINLIYQDELMDLVSTNPSEDSQSGNTLTWNFTDLTPFETRDIFVTMTINTPMDTPPVNGDDVLVFDASVSSSETDETPEDNAFTLNQTVVNSFDPNDKTCLEGDIISPDMVGDYVHYRIRFENTGTANAINVVVKDHIDRTKFDLSTLVPIDASHDFVARVQDNTDDYYVEFIFENINLPFDDANNDGYVVFKIKTLDTLVLNDTFENDAEIYFDFNFPIITNTAQTTVSTLSTEDFELADNSIALYPNPTQNTLHVKSKYAIEAVAIYDIAGRVIQEFDAGSKTVLDISIQALLAGTYFMEIKTENAKIVKAFIKE